MVSGTRISSSLNSIRDRYDVIVVGSGYGGGIAASRMARAGRSVCLLERGREFRPGEYPDTLAEGTKEVQVDLPDEHTGSRTGLFDFRVNDDMNVLIGCGLGGTSLINANVSLRAEPAVFDDPRWPKALLDDIDSLVEDGYRHAKCMLQPKEYPEDQPTLPKLQALEKAAHVMGKKFYRTPINVTFEDGTNHVGVEQRACSLCGDCVSGCNDAAKNTTLMNYLPDAWNHGAEIFTLAEVRWVERRGDRWLVHYQPLKTGRERFDAPPLFVEADMVILAAGTLGSTEILLRSREKGLAVSDRLGEGFSGNGDILGFAYNTEEEINGVGMGSRKRETMDPVGPCITGIIDMRNQKDLEKGMVIEEGSIPGLMASVLPGAFPAAEAVGGQQHVQTIGGKVRSGARQIGSTLLGARHGAVRNTQTYLVMGHDNGKGKMRLEDDRLRIDWPGIGETDSYRQGNENLSKAAEALDGTYVQNPMWSKLLKRRLITVHPLGGCGMAENAEDGVVDHKGQVFAGASGGDLHPGLFVCDGAVMPRPLGVNPLLTISALAERSMALVAREHGWDIDYSLPSAPSRASEVQRIGVQFTERMSGYVSLDPELDYQRAADEGNELSFTLTVVSHDLTELLDEPGRSAALFGTVDAPCLSERPLTATEGEFRLFVEDDTHVDTHRMTYRMRLDDEDDGTWCLSGYKIVHDAPATEAWRATSTLYITLHEGPDESGRVLGRGILRIRPKDFLKQMRTFEITHAPDLRSRLDAQARFGGKFAGVLWESYGGVLAPANYFDPDAPPRKRRTLAVGAPEVHFFETEDGVGLRLTRYEGGDKGPVILVHGLGVWSGMFAHDTLEVTPLEYLYAHGYDVWMLDWRGSIALPSSSKAFDCDDVARNDYHAAIPVVQEVTGAREVDMVVHCVGSITFFMAMLRGLPGVRSVVAMQVATDTIGSRQNQIKAGLHLGKALDLMGVKRLTAYTDTKGKWWNRIYDDAMAIQALAGAQGRCKSPVCHRMTFMYGSLYIHDNLDQATHDTMHEVFGVANIPTFEHLLRCVREKHVVSAEGEEIYLPHLEKLNLPITFIHGAENEIWDPESTAKTMERLTGTFGAGDYRRHLVEGYGHIDPLLGRNASRDVYPLILEHLESMRS